MYHEMGRYATYQPGDLILEEGSLMDKLFFIKTGTVGIEKSIMLVRAKRGSSPPPVSHRGRSPGPQSPSPSPLSPSLGRSAGRAVVLVELLADDVVRLRRTLAERMFSVFTAETCADLELMLTPTLWARRGYTAAVVDLDKDRSEVDIVVAAIRAVRSFNWHCTSDSNLLVLLFSVCPSFDL